MAWGSKVAATQLVTITTEQFFDTFISLNPGELAHVEVEVNFPATPTDHAIVAVYGTLDDASENWDDTPIMEFRVDKSLDPNKVSFVLSGTYKVRVGVRRDGSTDTLTSADLVYRKDGVSA